MFCLHRFTKKVATASAIFSLAALSTVAIVGGAGASAAPHPSPALIAAAQAQAKAAARESTPTITIPISVGAAAGLSAGGFVAGPDATEPINTVLGPYYADGCVMYTEFGNFYGVAFGKSEVYNNGSGCGVTDFILAYSGGNYAWGNVASAPAGTGWTNPQSTVSGYSIVSEYVQVCNTLQCTDYEFDAV